MLNAAEYQLTHRAFSRELLSAFPSHPPAHYHKLLWKALVVVLRWSFNVTLVAAHTFALLCVQYWKLFWHAQLVFAGAKRPGDAISEFASASSDLMKEGINTLFDGLTFTNV